MATAAPTCLEMRCRLPTRKTREVVQGGKGQEEETAEETEAEEESDGSSG